MLRHSSHQIYEPIPYEEFSRVCDERGVGLDDRLGPLAIEAAQAHQWIAAVSKAAALIRKEVGALAERPIPAEAIGTNPQVPETTFHALVNATVEPSQLTDEDIVAIPVDRTLVMGSCQQAEPRFGDTLCAMRLLVDRPSAPRPDRIGWRIIHSGETVIGIQKGSGQRTTLALQPVTIDGMSCPPGSLLACHSPQGRWAPYPGDTQIMDVRHVPGAQLLRLTPFAVEPPYRLSAFGQEPTGPLEWDLDYIQDVARRAMQYATEISPLGTD